ncbi:terminase [Actinoplanes sp. M2I2]|uniref:terminase n=1 Tax=Actinoplanes sp. M2I2 TaxID=1734444 RepID=UPI002021129D|nr:terminase [Actinoplanes sp. M2I2]
MTAVLAEPVLGSISPRLYTPPLVQGPPGQCGCGCALGETTSYGFKVERFAAEKLGRPLWPWQRWLVIHAGELLEDGTPRFRRVIVTVGRQNGKTEAVLALTLYWLFEEKKPSILGTSTLTKYAKKPWFSAFKMAVGSPELVHDMPENPHRKAIRKAAGEEEWWTADDCHYSVAASNAEGGRSMSNQRVIADELAKQYNMEAYSAAYYSMDAFEDAQYFGLTTPDPKGVLWMELRASALEFMDSGEGDETLGLFEWSVPEGADPADPQMLAMANPTMDRPGGKRSARLVREARAALAKGGELLRTFRTEIMCELLEDADAVIDLAAWVRCIDPGDLEAYRSSVAWCFDVAPSMQHAALYAAAVLPDGRVRIDAVTAWEGPGCVDQAARELPALVARAKPRAFGWLPSGPAAAVGARLADRSQPGRRAVWPPPGVAVEEIRGELTQVCMGFSALVAADGLAHSADPLLDDNVENAEKAFRGDAWVFSRKGAGDVDAMYAAAGAAHLARTLPAPAGRVRLVGPRGS